MRSGWYKRGKKPTLDTVDLSWLLGYQQRDLVAERGGKKKMGGDGHVVGNRERMLGKDGVGYWAFFLLFKCKIL